MALVCINSAIVSTVKVAPSGPAKPATQIERLYSGPTSTVWLSVTLVPGVAASLIYTDNQGLLTEIDFPTNAVTQTTTFILDIDQSSTSEPGYIFAGHLFFLIGPNKEFRFSAPVAITLEYSDRDIQQVPDEDQLRLYSWAHFWIDASNTCTPATAYTRNPSVNRISVPVCISGPYGLFGSYQTYLPLVAR